MGVMDGYWRWTLAAGEPIGLLYRIVDADGRVRPMLGERFALTIFDANRVARESVESTIEEDIEGDYVRTLMPLGTSDRLLGAGMLAWEFSRMLRGGERRPLFKGPLAIATSAGSTAVGSADFSEPDLFMIIDREEP